MEIGIFAKTFAGQSPGHVLACARDAGFDGVQYNMTCSGLDAMPATITAAEAAAVAQAATECHQQIFAVSATWNMIHPDPALRSLGHRRLATIAASAAAMGTSLITLCSGTRDPADQWRHHPDNTIPAAWADLLAAFEIAIAIAEQHDILLGVEPELANVVCDAAAARRLIDQMQSPRIRVVLDPANLFERAAAAELRDLIARAVDTLAGRIAMAHAKDRAPDGSFATAGKGVIDFEHFLQCLDDAGFSGPVVTHGLRADEAAATCAFLRGLLR